MNDLTLIVDDDSDSDKNLHRIEHSSVIAPGRHWQCLNKVTGISAERESEKFEFHEGLVYLVTRLEFFEGKLHSVRLLDDPSVSTQSGILTLDLFLPAFEQMTPEAAKEFRNQQIAEVNGRVAQVQQEMADAQTDPTLLQPLIDEGLRKWERELARQKGDDEEPGEANLPAVTTNGQFNLSGAIDHKIKSTDIAVFRHMAQREGKIAEIRAQWIQGKVKEMSKVLEKLTPFFSEPAAVGIAGAQSSLDMAKEAEKGIRSLNLYTGEGVEVHTIMSGKSAPSNEPLTLYQRKLLVNEEFAVWADVDAKFDYDGSSQFFKALCENEGLRQQIIPAPRGVVAMAIRRDNVRYDGEGLAALLENEAKNRANKALFLLVRDGENWYQVWSAEPSHELSPRLFPTRNEMEKTFEGIDGATIDFSDLRFTNRANEYDRKALVYKRFLILACGLDHRLKLFGHFYPETEAISFISMNFQKKYMRFVADDDADVMLGDTVGDVHSFISNNQRQLAAGARVLVFGKEALQQAAAPGAFSKGVYNNKTYKTEYYCMVDALRECEMLTVHRDKDDLVVYLPVRKHPKYDRFGQERAAANEHINVRVALNKLNKSSLLNEGVGFLLSDIISAKDLLPFIYNRRSRASYVSYIYAFKRAIPVLQAEEDARAPVQRLLEERAVTHYGLSKDVASKAVFSAIQTWREKMRHGASLPAQESAEFAKLDFELAEAAFAFIHAIPKVREYLENLGGRLVSVKRAKKGQLVAYYEQPDAERDPRITNWRWVGRRTFTPAGRPTKDTPESVSLNREMKVGEFELFSVDSVFFNQNRAGMKLADVRAALDLTAEMGEVLADAFKGERMGISDRAWLKFATTPAKYAKGQAERRYDTSWLAADRTVILPIGVKTDSGAFLGIDVELSELLYFYGSDAQRAYLLEQGYTPPAPKKDEDRKVIPYTGPKVKLYFDQYSRLESYEAGFNDNASTGHPDYIVRDAWFEGENRLNRDLGLVMAKAFDTEASSSFLSKYTVDPESLWFPTQVRAATGEFLVSQMFPGLPSA